jgi:hypothetical protein
VQSLLLGVLLGWVPVSLFRSQRRLDEKCKKVSDREYFSSDPA